MESKFTPPYGQKESIEMQKADGGVSRKRITCAVECPQNENHKATEGVRLMGRLAAVENIRLLVSIWFHPTTRFLGHPGGQIPNDSGVVISGAVGQ